MLYDVKENILTRAYPEKGDKKIVEIPSGIFGIGKEAFKGIMGVKCVVLPEGVRFIEAQAFADCYMLSDIKLPESLRMIGEEAFANCWNLKKIKFPRMMDSIGRAAFKHCSELQEAFLPDGLTVLETEIFSMCLQLRRISLPASIREIRQCRTHDEGMFFGSAVSEVHLRGGWYKDFSQALNITVFMQLQELYVQDVSNVPSRFLDAAISTFARHESEFSDEVKAHYYAHIRKSGRQLHDAAAHDEEICRLLLREDLIRMQEASGYFFAMLQYPERLAQLTEHLCRRQLLDDEALRCCLDAVIARGMPEITAMLLEYRGKSGGSMEEDDLTLD